MADKIFPSNVPQNPAPTTGESLEWKKQVRAQVENILADFFASLPDNYLSQVSGPDYVLNFQAIAEQVAQIQVSAQEVFSDTGFDFTRSEFLFQILGILVFPNGERDGIPTIEGDVTYRNFLKQMVLLLLQGATADVQKSAVELLTDANVALIEKSVAARNDPQSAWSFDDQFEFEISVSTDDNTFAGDPFVTEENVRLALQALKPAHTLYQYRNLFLEDFGDAMSDAGEAEVFDLVSYHYEEFRRYCDGLKCIVGNSGETFTDLTLFQDVTRDFSWIQDSAKLTITDGANAGSYFVASVFALPFGTDTTGRAYTTSPTGLTGTATVSGDVLTDASQNWALAEEGETITFAAGPNAGTYRLQTVLGLNGGPVGFATGPEDEVRVAPSMVRLRTRMSEPATGQSYCLEVDRLGVKTPTHVEDEDVSSFFYL